ncbi:ESX secretion-associated protein EspG [Amycolatopsis sp. H20-H5]|uniref:ESX secretion-associated protein EspG n=1 Tax=Amycolatopsis sp. H20-H5 TaxID=3046309 RepID=UPI002DBBF62E|nr:ESX secretion-associated protein EspG [Amycolatopsis sp. H20-H5]MEC3980656.1 ESX secretion-associated protein EspG [Amycolatopsis sp. H20-H5]
MLHRPAGISLQTYETLLEQQNLGDIHPTLVRGAQWYLPEERKQLAASAQAELAKLGLLRHGRPDGDFLDTLQMLQRPAVEYYSWVKAASGERTVRTARNDREAVIVVLVNGTVFLTPTRPETIATDFAAQLPEAQAAQVHSLNCAQADLEEIKRGKLPNGTSPSIRDAKRVLHWLQMEYKYFGQLYVAVREGQNKRRRNENPPGWLDTEQGRVLFGQDSNGWISLAGAGPQDVAKRLQQLENELRGR